VKRSELPTKNRKTLKEPNEKTHDPKKPEERKEIFTEERGTAGHRTPSFWSDEESLPGMGHELKKVGDLREGVLRQKPLTFAKLHSRG